MSRTWTARLPQIDESKNMPRERVGDFIKSTLGHRGWSVCLSVCLQAASTVAALLSRLRGHWRLATELAAARDALLLASPTARPFAGRLFGLLEAGGRLPELAPGALTSMLRAVLEEEALGEAATLHALRGVTGAERRRYFIFHLVKRRMRK
jgi:hypothetical protein